MRHGIIALLGLTLTLAAAPRPKDKEPDYKHIRVGLAFETSDGYRMEVKEVYTKHDGDGAYAGRAHVEFLYQGEGGMWSTIPYYEKVYLPTSAGNAMLKPPTLKRIDDLYRGKVPLARPNTVPAAGGPGCQ